MQRIGGVLPCSIACASVWMWCGAVRAQNAGPAVIEPKSCLALPQVTSSGRWALHRDPIEAQIVAGTWKPPAAGDSVELPGGARRTWQAIQADPDGAFRVGGYAYFDTAQVATTAIGLFEKEIVVESARPNAG